jgi:septal ring factor EnvC (AmiA/AmiB activator)
LVIVLDKHLESAEEKMSNSERICARVLDALDEDHIEALTLLKEQHGVGPEAERAELEGLERKFSDQAKELTRVQAWATRLQYELTSAKAAVKVQSQMLEQSVQPLKDEVSRLETERRTKMPQ